MKTEIQDLYVGIDGNGNVKLDKLNTNTIIDNLLFQSVKEDKLNSIQVMEKLYQEQSSLEKSGKMWFNLK